MSAAALPSQAAYPVGAVPRGEEQPSLGPPRRSLSRVLCSTHPKMYFGIIPLFIGKVLEGWSIVNKTDLVPVLTVSVLEVGTEAQGLSAVT